MSEISKQALKVDNTQSFPNNSTGYITPALLRAFNDNVIDSTVNQTVYTADSSSWNAQIDALEAFTASQQPSFTALNAFTASQLTVNSGYNSFTQSANAELDSLSAWTGSWNTWTSSINEIRDDGVLQGYSTRFFFEGLVSASITQNVGGPIATIKVEQDGTKLNTSSFNSYTASTAATQSVFSASVATSITTISSSLNAFTASQTIWNASATSSIQQLLDLSSSLSGGYATQGELDTFSASVAADFVPVNYSITSLSSKTGSYATTGSNTFIGKQTIDGNQNGIVMTGFESFIDLSGYNSHISMYSGTGSIRFYTGSADGNGTSNIDTWVNMQVNPANGALAISSFPSNNHFVDFDVQQTASLFTAPIKGMSGLLTIGSNTVITGSLATNGGATFGNNQSQYNNIELKTSNATYPGNLYNTIYINSDNNGEYSAGIGVSTYTEFGSSPVAFLFGGGNGNKVDSGNTAIKLANGDIYIQKDTIVNSSLTITGSVYQNVNAVSIASSTASIDLSVANYFTLTLAGDTKINVTNPRPGVTATLVVTVGTAATASFSSNVKQVSGSAYYASPSGSTDVISLTSVDSTNVYLVPAYSFV